MGNNSTIKVLSVISLIIMGSFSGIFISRQFRYKQLAIDFLELLDDYEILIGEYEGMSDNYNELLIQYTTLNAELSAIKYLIQSSTLPVQYLLFAESVRRNYMSYYIGAKRDKELYTGCVEFLRDMSLHDSQQGNVFQEVSDVFENYFPYITKSMDVAYAIMHEIFWKWTPTPKWGGTISSGNDLIDIINIYNWCVDEINYEYDQSFTYEQYAPQWDYFKLPVETAFRTLGDCEDQATFLSSYYESCGYQTAIAVTHDEARKFCHASLFVHITNVTQYNLNYTSSLFNLGEIDPYENSTWCWLDPTWDISFGEVIPWAVVYGGFIPDDVISIAICDVNGEII